MRRRRGLALRLRRRSERCFRNRRHARQPDGQGRACLDDARGGAVALRVAALPLLFFNFKNKYYGNRKKSIFKLGDKFGIESPLGDWMKEARVRREERDLNYNRTTRSSSDKLLLRPSKPQQDDSTPHFDPNRCTIRIGWHHQYNEFILRDKNGCIMNYQSDEDYKGEIHLPQGALVVKLNKNKQNNRYYHIIAWYNGKYREGYISELAFENPPAENNPFNAEVFINDVEHILERVEHGTLVDGSNEGFWELYQLSLRDFSRIRSGNTKVNNEILKQVKDAYDLKTKIKGAGLDRDETFDSVGVLERYKELIYSVFDPVNKGKKKFSKSTMVVPLFPEWFKQNRILQKRYTEIWLRGQGILNRFAGVSGEVALKEHMHIIGEELLFVKKMPQRNTPVGEWLSKLKNDSFESIESMIFIHTQTWNYTNRQKYATGIGLESSFGSLRAAPLHTVLLHEFNGSMGGYFPSESHLSEYDTKKVWLKVSKSGLSSEIQKDPEQLGSLFQSDYSLALACLAYFLKKIKELQ